MSDHPVEVGAPDERGLRTVRIQGMTAGSVWSRRGLHRLLRRAGLPRSIDLTDTDQVQWLGDPDYCRGVVFTTSSAALLAAADAVGDIGWTVSVDATVVRGHQHAAGALKRGPCAATSRPTTHSDVLAAG